jgi:hypothetical protein
MNNIAGRKESFISFPVNPDYVSALCTFPAYVKPSPKMPISMNGSAASM